MNDIWSKIYTDLHVKCPLLLSDFNETLIFSAHFLKILKYQISWQSVQWEPKCSMRASGQSKLTVAFRNFADAPKNVETKNQTEWRKWQSKYLKRVVTGDFLCKRFIDHEIGRNETHFHQFKYRKLCCHTRSPETLSFDLVSLQQHFNSTDTASPSFNKRPQTRIVLGLPDFQDALSGGY